MRKKHVRIAKCQHIATGLCSACMTRADHTEPMFGAQQPDQTVRWRFTQKITATVGRSVVNHKNLKSLLRTHQQALDCFLQFLTFVKRREYEADKWR